MGREPESPVKALLSVVASVGLPVTVVSALMLYFGWARADQQARYMGLDVSLFGFTAQDYVLRSISTLFVPLLAIGLLGLAWLGAHQVLLGRLEVPKWRPALRLAGRAAFVAGFLAAAGALITVLANRVAAPLVAPLVLAAGTAVAAYGLWLGNAAAERRKREPLPVGQRALRILFVTAIVVLALFWELSNYAGVVGRGYALQIADTVGTLPRATAFSTAPLGIELPGVAEERIAENPPAYRTTGLRLLVRSGGRLFLLHEGWTPQRGTVVVLADTSDISWQFSR